MLLRNSVSRYTVMEAAVTGGAKHNEKVAIEMMTLLGEIRKQVSKVSKYIMDTGKDPEGTFEVPRFEGTVFEKGAAANGADVSKEDGFFVN